MKTLILLKHLFLCTFFLFVFVSCKMNSDVPLVGSWRLDSIYYFDNGFTYTNRAPYPSEVHVYRSDSTFLRRGMGRENRYTYSLNIKELLIKDSSDGPGAKLTIIRADSTVLAIRKEKSLIFPGKNQERFEIRFFTRLPNDSIK